MDKMSEEELELLIDNLTKPYRPILGSVLDNEYDHDAEEYFFSTEFDWRDIDNHVTTLEITVEMSEESPTLHIQIKTQKHGSHSDWEIYMEEYVLADPLSIKIFHEDLSKFLLGFYEDKKPHVECQLIDCENAIKCLNKVRKNLGAEE
jgi:hypothetical protein